jgi:hypothetical protein
MWQSIFGAGQSNDSSASFIQGQLTEISMTLFRHSGTAGSFLLLFIFIALILGIPLILIAIRVIEIISEKRHEAASRVEEEYTAEEPSAGGKPSAVKEESKKDAGEWTPAKHMR